MNDSLSEDASMLPADVRDLVIAAREFWYDCCNSSPQSRALDRALEAFKARVPLDELNVTAEIDRINKPKLAAEPAEDTPEVKRDKDAARIDRLQRENAAQAAEIQRLRDMFVGRWSDQMDTAERALLLVERNRITTEITMLADLCDTVGGARAREAITRLTNNITGAEVPF